MKSDAALISHPKANIDILPKWQLQPAQPVCKLTGRGGNVIDTIDHVPLAGGPAIPSSS